MEISKLGKWLGAGVVVVAAGLCVGGGLVLAQQPDTPPGDSAGQPVTPPAAGTGAGTGSGGAAAGAAGQVGDTPDDTIQSGMTKRADVSAADMVSRADTYLAGMREVLKRVVQLQGIARKQKDVIKLNCVNDKLLQIKQLLNIGEANKTNLDEAIAREDESGRYDFFSNITIANDQVTTLGAEAEQCIGQDLSFLGPTQTTVEGGNEPDDPTQSEEPDFPVVELPPVASPFI
jgi:hypothetical protein